MTTSNVAFIVGVSGQDGAHLAEFLLEKEYEVHGIKYRSGAFNIARVNHSLVEWWRMSFSWMLFNLVSTSSARKSVPATCVVSTSWSQK